MKLEVQHAVDFLITLLKKKCKNMTKVEHFRREITNLLFQHISEHWYPQNSLQGSAYRCIRVQCLKIDPIVLKAAQASGFNNKLFSNIFPEDFCLWIDPYDVCYRIGEFGSFCPLYFVPELDRPEEHRPKTPTLNVKTSPARKRSPLKRSSPVNLKGNRSDNEDSSYESSSSTSGSPPSPTYLHPNSCKEIFPHSQFNPTLAFSAYVTS